MHFWVSAARVSLPGMAPAHLVTSGARWARKIGTNWFMPAFVNSRFGESGIKLDEGTMVWPFDLKKSKKDCRISALVISLFLESIVNCQAAGGRVGGRLLAFTYARYRICKAGRESRFT